MRGLRYIRGGEKGLGRQHLKEKMGMENET